MLETKIHPTAIIGEGVEIGQGVEIGPYCIIEGEVKIGDETTIKSHSTIKGIVTIGERNTIFSYCSIGEEPQDFSYKGERTKVEIGDKNTLREYVSIHRGTLKQDGLTKVGNSNYLMAYVHLGHDVIIGNNILMANNTNLAGHVEVGDKVILSGGTLISQFVRIGRSAYIGGASGIHKDIPPFCTALGNRVRLKGINIIGLKRSGHARKDIAEAVEFYRDMEASSFSPRAFVDQVDKNDEIQKNTIVKELIDFVNSSKLGLPSFVS